MAWCRTGDKPLSEPMLSSLLTHVCVTRPQWVKCLSYKYFSHDLLGTRISGYLLVSKWRHSEWPKLFLCRTQSQLTPTVTVPHPDLGTFTKNKISSIWQLCRHLWHWKLSLWQLMVPPMTTKLSNWRSIFFRGCRSKPCYSLWGAFPLFQTECPRQNPKHKLQRID